MKRPYYGFEEEFTFLETQKSLETNSNELDTVANLEDDEDQGGDGYCTLSTEQTLPTVSRDFDKNASVKSLSYMKSFLVSITLPFQCLAQLLTRIFSESVHGVL